MICTQLHQVGKINIFGKFFIILEVSLGMHRLKNFITMVIFFSLRGTVWHPQIELFSDLRVLCCEPIENTKRKKYWSQCSSSFWSLAYIVELHILKVQQYYANLVNWIFPDYLLFLKGESALERNIERYTVV